MRSILTKIRRAAARFVYYYRRGGFRLVRDKLRPPQDPDDF